MEKARRRKIPLWARIAISVLLALLALVAAGVGLRYWITSDGGRAFIVSQIDGRRLGPLGAIRVEGLDGDPLEAATFADIALVDDDGVWLRARDARIEWTPERLLAGDLEIQAIQIRLVEVMRAPRTTYESDRRPPPDISLRLDEIIIDELRLASDVLSEDAAHYRISGGAARGRDGTGFVQFDVYPLAGPADRIAVNFEWSPGGPAEGEVKATGPADGVLATVIGAPEKTPVAITASLTGVLADFQGAASLTFDGQPVALIDVTRQGDTASFSASLASDKWPLLGWLAQRTGGLVTLEGDASLADIARAQVNLLLAAPAGEIRIAAPVDLERFRLRDAIRLSTENLDLSFVAPPLRGEIDATGTARLIGFADFVWEGGATATGLEYPSGAMARVAGPLVIRKTGPSISWETERAAIEGGRVTALRSLAPASYTGLVRGEVNLATRIVEVTQAQIIGAPGQVTARGTYAIRTGAFQYAGAASFNRLSDLAPLTGAARGQWSVQRTSLGAPVRITAHATGRNVSSRIDALAQLAGESPVARITGVVRDGRFTLESGSFRGAGMAANMTGRIADDGAIAGRASGALRRPLSLSGATIDALSFSADMSGRLSAPHLDIRLANGTATIGGIRVDDVVGEAGAVLGDTVAGSFSLSGGTYDQPLHATGRIEGDGGDWRIVGLNAQFDGVSLAAPRLAYADGIFTTAFEASGSLAGIAGLDRGTLSARGTISAGEALNVDISGQLANLRSGLLRVDLLSFDADASQGQATLAGQLRGTLGATVDLAFRAVGRDGGEAWSGTATVDGSVDDLPVSTSRPAAWTFGAGGWEIDAALGAFGGRIDADAAASPQMASATFDVANLDLQALSRLARITPINGRVTGRSTFSNGPGPATADLQVAIADANPVGVTADPVHVNLTGRLREGELTAIATGAGAGFRLETGAQLPMDDLGGFNIVPDRTEPLEARVSLTGRAAQMWALFGPEDQVLRGQIDADIRAGGTLNRPTLTGGFSVAEGAYEHGETGLRLADITAKGVFDQRSARITSFSANDGDGGALTAEGTIDWEDGLDGGVEFAASNLRALRRDDRSAIVSGEGAVTLDEEAIHVSGDLTVNQARFSIEQTAGESIPTLPSIRRINFPDREDETTTRESSPWGRPVQLDLHVEAPRRVFVFGRGLDTEWAVDLDITGVVANPEVEGTATLIRGDLDLAGRRFAFDTGAISLAGPISSARIDISAERQAEDIDARVRLTGSLTEPEFVLESTPSLPQDEILARVLFGRSAAELSAFEAAQLAAGLTQLAGGQAGFDPAGLVRDAIGVDRVAIGASGGAATLSAGKYIADDVYLQVGAGGKGGVAAEVEWEPRENLSIISSAQGNGDTKITVRWKNDY